MGATLAAIGGSAANDHELVGHYFLANHGKITAPPRPS
jgi:hypothetical protein